MDKKLLDSFNVQLPKFDFKAELPNHPVIDTSVFDLPEVEPIPPELSKDRIDYEDTVLKDFAEEIKAVQLETNRQLAQLIEENRKSDLISRRIIIATLIVATLTLVATVVGLIL